MKQGGKKKRDKRKNKRHMIKNREKYLKQIKLRGRAGDFCLFYFNF